MFFEGQKFCLTRRVGEVVYYHCAQKTISFCRASLREENRLITVIREHNGHAIVENPVDRFRCVLLRRATQERTSAHQIYSEEIIRNPEAALLYPWRTAQSSMNSARRRSNPAIPVTLMELGGILGDVRWVHKFFSTIRVPPHLNVLENFFRQVVEHDGTSSLLFASQYLIDRAVAGATEIHVDGSFKAVPSAPAAHQLLMVHCLVQNKIFPIAYCLMHNRERQSYDNIFAAIRILAPTLLPEIIITDHEQALQQSLASTYPEARIVGSFYHYATAVWKKASHLQILASVRNRPLHRKAVKLLMVLPLLPAANIVAGLNEVEAWCNREHVAIPSLFQYMRRYWIQTISPEAISVYEHPHLTNNYIESFNKVLLDKTGPEPNVYDFIEKLIQMSESALVNYTKYINGLRITRPVTSRYLLNDVRIKDAQLNLRTGILSVFNYLEVVSPSVDNMEQRLINIQRHIQPIIDEPDDIDEPPDERRPRLSLPMRLLTLPVQRLPTPVPRLPSPLPPSTVHEPDDVEHTDESSSYLPLPVPLFPSPLPASVPRLPSTVTRLNLFDLPDYIQRLMSDSSSSSEEDESAVASEIGNDENIESAGEQSNANIIDEAIFHLPEHEEDPLPDIGDDTVNRWKAQVSNEDEDVPQCLVCLICCTRRKSYSLQCGHTYCGTCAEFIYNKIFATCPECRQYLLEDPRKIFL